MAEQSIDSRSTVHVVATHPASSTRNTAPVAAAARFCRWPRQAARMLLDMTGVTYMSSAGLRLLLSIYRAGRRAEAARSRWSGSSEETPGHDVGDRLPRLLHRCTPTLDEAVVQALQADELQSAAMDTDRSSSDARPSQGLQASAGSPFPFGATFVPGGVNFSVFSRHATACTLVLFDKGAAQPMAEIPFPDEFRIGNVFSMIVFDLDLENVEYGYRMDGPFDPAEGHRFDRTKILLDPYAKAIGGRDVWGEKPDWNDVYPAPRPAGPRRLRLGGRPAARTARSRTRSSTRCTCAASPGTRRRASSIPGTFAGHPREDPVPEGAGRQLRRADADLRVRRVREQPAEPGDRRARCCNYWGYSTVGFFAPKAGYAATGQLGHAGRRVQDARQGAAQERHRGHPRRGLQPHRRGQRARARRSRSAGSTTRPTTC